jgi:hypothetical protein
MVYNPVPEERAPWARRRGPRPAWQARYLATLEPLTSWGEPLRVEEVTLDFYHVAEHWHDFA